MSLTDVARQGKEEEIDRVIEEFKRLVDNAKGNYEPARAFYREQRELQGVLRERALGHYKEMSRPFPRGV